MTKDIFFDRVTVLGVGLIGGSFALAMKKRRLCGHICGFGRKETNLVRARDMGMIDSFALDPAEASVGSDLILFSLPIGFFTETAKRIKSSLKTGALVTDAGSVKGRLVCQMEDILSDKVSFIGAHPIAGSDKSGIDTAGPDLFLGRRCIVTATDRSNRSAMDLVVSLWQCLGAEVVPMSPEEHDRVFGAVSHLPHLIAYEMVNAIDEIDSSYLGYSGQGFADTTRIAASSPELWRDISIFNAENLAVFIDVFIGRLEKLKRNVVSGRADLLESEFRKAKALRDSIGQD
ncbi:MAG TPA: prephenate dehydrogenase/arogenate dehydrogenase family protein [Thermodesulfovibrionales bacterium]|nr:prephenate dehydrogenase/arogenate dehydrogenase family protein [Thermodesulfovibrionales bacterium]